MPEFTNLSLLHCDETAPFGSDIYPSIKDIRVTPLLATPLQGLGYRGKVTIQFQDFPLDKGTYFGRLLAANPYYLDRHLFINTGFYNQGDTFDLANFKERLYFIKSIDGPSDKGVVTVEAVDILSKLDGDQAMLPEVRSLALADPIPDYVGDPPVLFTNQLVTFAGSQPPGLFYYVRINDEIMLASNDVNDDWFISGRGSLGTKIESHEVGDQVQVCYARENVNVVDAIYQLFDQYSGIDVLTYINLSEWQAERDSYLLGENIDIIVSEPTPVKDIIESLTTQAYVLIWWDDTNQKIRIKAIGPNLGAVKSINHNQHILNVGHRIRTSQSKAINEVWVYYSRKNWATDRTKPSNYQELFVYVDSQAANDLGVRKIKKIFADNIRTLDTATRIARRYVAQNKQGYRTLYFRLDPSNADVDVGDIIEITTDIEQGVEGNPVSRSYLITQKEEASGYVEFQADATGFLLGEETRYARIAPNDTPVFTIATEAQKLTYAFLAGENSLMSDGSPSYLLL